MNKIFRKLLIIISIMAIALVGCSGELKEEKIVENVLKNFRGTRNVEFDFKQEVKKESTDKIDTHVKLDLENLRAETNLKIMGMDSKVYAEKKDEKSFTAYFNFMGVKWMKTVIESKDTPLTQDALAGAMKKLYDMVNKYEVFEVEKKEDSYVLKSDTEKLSKYKQQIDGVKEEEIKDQEKKINVEWTIGKKDFNIISIKAYNEEINVSIDNFKKSNESIEIPKEAKDNATDINDLRNIFNDIKIEE